MNLEPGPEEVGSHLTCGSVEKKHVLDLAASAQLDLRNSSPEVDSTKALCNRIFDGLVETEVEVDSTFSSLIFFHSDFEAVRHTPFLKDHRKTDHSRVNFGDVDASRVAEVLLDLAEQGRSEVESRAIVS